MSFEARRAQQQEILQKIIEEKEIKEKEKKEKLENMKQDLQKREDLIITEVKTSPQWQEMWAIANNEELKEALIMIGKKYPIRTIRTHWIRDGLFGGKKRQEIEEVTPAEITITPIYPVEHVQTNHTFGTELYSIYRNLNEPFGKIEIELNSGWGDNGNRWGLSIVLSWRIEATDESTFEKYETYDPETKGVSVSSGNRTKTRKSGLIIQFSNDLLFYSLEELLDFLAMKFENNEKIVYVVEEGPGW